MCAIDFICGPPGLCTHVSRLDPAHEAGLLSDHAGYVAEIDIERERTDG